MFLWIVRAEVVRLSLGKLKKWEDSSIQSYAKCGMVYEINQRKRTQDTNATVCKCRDEGIMETFSLPFLLNKVTWFFSYCYHKMYSMISCFVPEKESTRLAWSSTHPTPQRMFSKEASKLLWKSGRYVWDASRRGVACTVVQLWFQFPRRRPVNDGFNSENSTA